MIFVMHFQAHNNLNTVFKCTIRVGVSYVLHSLNKITNLNKFLNVHTWEYMKRLKKQTLYVQNIFGLDQAFKKSLGQKKLAGLA